MKAWTWVILMPLLWGAASCGISGGEDDPGDPTKKDLEVLGLAVSPTDSSAVVTWRTNEQAVGTLQYGMSAASLNLSESSPLGTEHSAVLEPLQPDTDYWLQVTAASPLGPRFVAEPVSFRTLVAVDLFDTTGPVISDIEVNGITAESATISWRTDDRTNGTVFYGTSSAYGSASYDPDLSAYGRTHSRILTGLAEGTSYHFAIQATNMAGLTGQSGDQAFTTSELPWLEFAPDTLRLQPGQEGIFSVRVRGIQNLAAISLRVGFDASMIELISVRAGRFFEDPNDDGSADGHLFLQGGGNDPNRGRIHQEATWRINFQNDVAVGTNANGGGDVAILRARAVGDGAGSSDLRFILDDEYVDGKPDTRLLDHNRQPMTFHVRDGLVVRLGQ